MGLSSWIRDLGVPWKVSVCILGGVAVVTSAYGLYIFYVHHTKQSKHNDETFHDETAIETLEKKVLVLGLESAGKSTFLAALAKQDTLVTSQREATTPTEGFHIVCISTEGVNLNIWEIGGKFQSYWPNFVADTHVIVYAIDSSDTDQLGKSKVALLEVLSDVKLKGVPLVLLVCKQDLKGAKPFEDVASIFEIDAISSNRPSGIAAIKVLDNGEVSGVQEAKQLILTFCK